MHARQQKDVVLEKIDHLIKVNPLEFIFPICYKYWSIRKADIFLIDVLKLKSNVQNGASDPQADKKSHALRSDVRTLLLLAGEKTAQMAAAQVLYPFWKLKEKSV